MQTEMLQEEGKRGVLITLGDWWLWSWKASWWRGGSIKKLKLLGMCADLNFHQDPRDPVVAKTILYSRKVSPSTQQMLKPPRELFRGLVPEPGYKLVTMPRAANAQNLQEPGRAPFLVEAPADQQGEQARHSPRPRSPGGEGWVEAQMLRVSRHLIVF